MKTQERTQINDISKKDTKQVLIEGFIQTIRDQGKIKFLILRDVSGILQCVVTKDCADFEKVSKISLESVVEIIGIVKAEKQAPGGFEVQTENINILSISDPNLPIPVVSEKGGEETDAPKRFDYRWIDLRKPERQQIFRVWTSLEKGAREFLNENGFIQIYTPSFMSTPSESGAEVFEVSYFEGKSYLAQSPQFYKQMAMASGFEKVFMVGPVFRAEPSFTTRHMTEFTGWDFEVSYIHSHEDIMQAEEAMLVKAFEQVKSDLGLDIEIPKIPFPKVSIKEAKEKLKKAGVKSEKFFDLSPEEEREISVIIKNETGHDFVFLTDYPIEARPFYHMRHEDNLLLTKSFDLLYKGLEVTTGAQREHRYDVLVKQAKEKGMSVESLKYYLDFFKYGCPPHGGVGIGPGRLVMKMLDLASVKEATFLPRDVKRLTP